MYEHTERKSESYTKRILFVKLGIFSIGKYILFIVGFEICTVYNHCDMLKRIFQRKADVLFDTSTALEFALRFLIFAHGSFVYSLTISTISYLMSCCFYIKVCCKHFEMIVTDLNERINAKSRNSTEQSWRISQILKIAASFHVKILE